MPRYTVTGSQPVLDHQPGETFDADLDPNTESFLVGIGALSYDKHLSRSEPAEETPHNSVEEQVKRLNVKSYNVNGPREEKRR